MPQYSFVQLQKLAKKDSSVLPHYSLAVIGDCATQHLATAIKGMAFANDLALDIFDADYNQIDAQLMDKNSELYNYAPKTILICMCVEKLYEAFCASPLGSRADFAQSTCERILNYWTLIQQNINTQVLQFNFVDYNDKVFGSFAFKVDNSFKFQLQKLNYLLADMARSVKNIQLIDLNSIQSELGRKAFREDKLYYIAKMPIATNALPHVAKAVVDAVNAKNGRFKKCVILDLDNTLWGGVIGDDGIDGIQIGELGIGHAFTDLQVWLKELKNRGIILAICSKNDENIAKEPFINHPDMILRMDDISLFVANWKDKVSNIRYIQQILNIGMDSIVFIDDNPFERNAVLSMIPEVTVPELPEDPALYLSYLQSLNLFETAAYSKADVDRTAQYQAEAGRVMLQQQYSNYEEYLQSLEMMATAKPFDSFNYPRIAQLTQRSNQFNLRTIRYSEAEIEAIANDDAHIAFYFTLKDKFGDHGLVSVVIMDKQSEDSLFISTWLMSCRVLKRGMEEFIVNQIIKVAYESGFKRVIGEYIPTQKNSMVAEIYPKLGFEHIGDGSFKVDVEKFIPNKTYITKEN